MEGKPPHIITTAIDSLVVIWTLPEFRELWQALIAMRPDVRFAVLGAEDAHAMPTQLRSDLILLRDGLQKLKRLNPNATIALQKSSGEYYSKTTYTPSLVETLGAVELTASFYIKPKNIHWISEDAKRDQNDIWNHAGCVSKLSDDAIKYAAIDGYVTALIARRYLGIVEPSSLSYSPITSDEEDATELDPRARDSR